MLEREVNPKKPHVTDNVHGIPNTPTLSPLLPARPRPPPPSPHPVRHYHRRHYLLRNQH